MEFLDTVFSLGETSVVLLGTFLIVFWGYALGSFRVGRVKLGTAGVFMVALLFGYLYTLPGLEGMPLLGGFFVKDMGHPIIVKYKLLESMGLVLFVTSVGFIAGPGFFRNLRANIRSYVPLSVVIVLIGSLLAIAFAVIPGIGSSFSTGVLSGALTSTPAFSAAKAVAREEGMVSLGHAVAYPFGVVSLVLFVQIVPGMLKCDLAEERARIAAPGKAVGPRGGQRRGRVIDGLGYGVFALAMVFGVLLGSIRIPITNRGFDGVCFSLGNTGGTLIVALLLGSLGRLGRLSCDIPESTLRNAREFGLTLFLVGAGVEGGAELVAQIQNSPYGPMLIVYGFIAGVAMKVLPMLVSFVLTYRVFKLPLLNALGAMTGGMTSTPALGTLIDVAGTDQVAVAYASAYPVTLVLIVLASNLIGMLIP